MFSKRSIGWWLCACLILTSDASLMAQRNRKRNQPLQPRANPVHEQLKQQAEDAYRRGKYDLVVKLTTSVLRQNPRDHVAYYLRGSARVDQGVRQGDNKLVRAGIADAREAIRLASSTETMYYLPYLNGMTNLTNMEGRRQHAEVVIDQVGQLIALPRLKSAEKSNLYYQRAFAYVSTKNFDKAVADYKRALQLTPTHMGALVGICDAYASAGKQEEAIASYAAAIKTFPMDPELYNRRGMFWRQLGKREQAVADFTRAIERNPKYFYSFTNRGVALMEMGNTAAAEADFDKSLELNPQQPMVHSLRGTAHLAEGKADEAERDYANVIRLVPRNAVARSDYGFAKFFAKDYAAAATAFEQALQLDKNLRYLEPWLYAAIAGAGRTEEAAKRFESSAKKQLKSRDWYDRLITYQMGDAKDQDVLGVIDSKDPQAKNAQLCEAHFFIGLKKSRDGDTAAAEKHFQESLNTKATHLSAYRGAQFATKHFSTSKPDGGGN